MLQFYVKELLWNEKSREHRRAKSNRVWCAECFWRARRSRSEFLRGGCGEQTVAWFYGCRRVMRTPQSPTKGPDQDDLIRSILKHSKRRRDSSRMRRIRIIMTPQSPRDLIRMTWIRGILKHCRRRRGHSHCKSSAREATSSQGGSWASANVNRYEE